MSHRIHTLVFPVIWILGAATLATACAGDDCDCFTEDPEESCAPDCGSCDAPNSTDSGVPDRLSLPFTPSNLPEDFDPVVRDALLFDGAHCAQDAAVDTDALTVTCLHGELRFTPEWAVVEQEDGTEAAVLFGRSLLVGQTISVRVEGQRPLIVAVADEAVVRGRILARDPVYSERGHCGGASGSSLPEVDGNGLGGGGAGLYLAGGGGGGHCGPGGPGGATDDNPEGARGGPVFGTAEISPLTGGSSGGNNEYGRGGGGGGALQVVAGRAIRIATTGSINMGGNGGETGGGGGGSGGAILLEAPEIDVAGTLAANGGGGAAGYTGGDGESARASIDPARGAPGDELMGGGGAGAAGDVPKGAAGEAHPDNGGGGGGGAGRIRLNTIDGAATLSGVLSPAPRTGCATFGGLTQ
jgi:hypothetical protein